MVLSKLTQMENFLMSAKFELFKYIAKVKTLHRQQMT